MELHVVFNYSAAVDVRNALVGSEAVVARFSDNLSYGPINPVETSARRAWIDHHLGFDNPDITNDDNTFWPKVLTEDASRVAWVSRRSAAEYCCFLEYLRRLGDLPTQVVDTTDIRCGDGEFFRSTASIPVGYILRDNLVNSAQEIDAKSRSDCLILWERLRSENRALRVVDKDMQLLSTPLSFYDEQLLALTGENWRSMARIIGDFLGNEPADVSDLLLFSRLYSLVDAGALDMREVGKRHPEVKLVRP